MNWTCAEAPAGYDELAAAGVATAPCAVIRPPRIASAPVSFECRVVERLDFAPAATVVIGQVLALHMDDRFVDPKRLHVDTPAMQLMARMHGAGWYTRSTDRIQRDRPSFEDLRRKATVCDVTA
jgi:flavin reductase (DIM6/NTAB) family NADH-FMN oxidoreductase RutF